MNKERGINYIKVIMSLVMGLLLFSPYVEASEKGSSEDPYIITTDVTYTPFEFQNADGEYVGIDVDIIRAIAEDQGFEIELRPLNFSASLQALETNQVDGMIAAMSITEERSKSFDFSDPYFEGGSVMAVSIDNEEITSYEDLEGKRVAVKVGTLGADFANELNEQYDFEITQFEDSATMYEEVVTGHSDAVFDDYPVLAYAIQQGLQLQLPTEPESDGEYGFAVNKDQNPELLAMFNEGLANIKESGEYDDIIDTYLSEDTEVTDTSNSNIFSLIKNNWRDLASGLGRTLVLTLVSFGIALFLGTMLGLFSVSKNKILNVIAAIYLNIMRGMPLIVLAFFIYFSIPQLLNITLTAFAAGVTTLTLNTAAYVSEQVRGGIQAVAVGQLEAGRSLGLSYGNSMRKIILPQAIKIMIPSLINQFVITLKDTSILSVIGIVELTQSGRIIIARTYSSGSMWLIIGAMYIIIIYILTKISNRIEQNLMND